MPLLMAFMPLILVPLIELIVFRSSYFAEAVFGRGGMMPLFRGMDMEAFFDEDRMQVNEELVELVAHLDIVQFLTSPSLWAGFIVCGLLTTAAIYVRRYRDDQLAPRRRPAGNLMLAQLAAQLVVAQAEQVRRETLVETRSLKCRLEKLLFRINEPQCQVSR